jgi:hypothetical protein
LLSGQVGVVQALVSIELDWILVSDLLFGSLESRSPILKPNTYALGAQREHVGQAVNYVHVRVVCAKKRRL